MRLPGRTLTEVTMTLSACPSQWDAATADGQYVYIRYRGGHFSVDQSATKADSHHGTYEPLVSWQLGDDLDGDMTTPEMLEHLTRFGFDVSEVRERNER